jgi:hypothetical protein
MGEFLQKYLHVVWSLMDMGDLIAGTPTHWWIATGLFVLILGVIFLCDIAGEAESSVYNGRRRRRMSGDTWGWTTAVLLVVLVGLPYVPTVAAIIAPILFVIFGGEWAIARIRAYLLARATAHYQHVKEMEEIINDDP